MFKQRYKPMVNPPELDQDNILYDDPDGNSWVVPLNCGHWIERDVYQPWLAAGNLPLPPA